MDLSTPTQLYERVNAAIAAVEYPLKPEGLYEPIEYVLSLGGKRIRPVFLLLSSQLFGGDLENILPAAIALETFHNYTLLHDDLMDNADMRRGKTTVHKRWNENTAILSGDAMLELAYKKMFAVTTGKTDKAMQVFLKTALEVSEGQQFDMNFEMRTDVALSEYFKMIHLKTGVLIACALKMGALLSDASEDTADLLYKYGENIGRAFQLQDDYLDVYGDPAVFGKRIGGDILEGKKTFLLISALDKADEAQRREMEEWLSRKTFNAQEKITYFTKLYTVLNVPEDYKKEMAQCFVEADRILGEVDAPQEAKALLKSFSDTLMNRTF